MLNYKPCRVIQSYKIENYKAYIVGFDHVIELNSVSSVFWDMANGKNTLQDIIDKIISIFDISDKEKVYNDLIKLMDKLSNEGLIVQNWDPLYKEKINMVQEARKSE